MYYLIFGSFFVALCLAPFWPAEKAPLPPQRHLPLVVSAAAEKKVAPPKPEKKISTLEPAPAPSPPSRPLERDFDFSAFPELADVGTKIIYSKDPPAEVVLRRPDRTHRFAPISPGAESSAKSPKSTTPTLYLATNAYARAVAESRRADAAQQSQPGPERRMATTAVVPGLRALPADAYRVASFSPGTRDDRLTLIQSPFSLEGSLQGPDYSFEKVDENDKEGLARVRANVVSFGHGGSMILEIKDHGFIQDRAGADFVIYENVFRVSRNMLWQEFAQVGVSSKTSRDEDFVWYPCEPDRDVIYGCAGVVPTSEGGDAFDLGYLGVDKVRFIKIKDVGTNYNLGENTEGFDLDALRILHAFTEGAK